MGEKFFPECEALHALVGKSVHRSEKPPFALIHCRTVLLNLRFGSDFANMRACKVT